MERASLVSKKPGYSRDRRVMKERRLEVRHRYQRTTRCKEIGLVAWLLRFTRRSATPGTPTRASARAPTDDRTLVKEQSRNPKYRLRKYGVASVFS